MDNKAIEKKIKDLEKKIMDYNKDSIKNSQAIKQYVEKELLEHITTLERGIGNMESFLSGIIINFEGLMQLLINSKVVSEEKFKESVTSIAMEIKKQHEQHQNEAPVQNSNSKK